MKKIPNKLKIGGHMFKVIEKDMVNNLGETDFHKCTITIEKDMPQSLKTSTLLHEVICHCINTTFTGEHHLAHGFMDSISEQIFQVLSDNKMLK